MKKVVFIFWAIGILHVCGQFLNNEQIINYTKPLIIPLLALFYYHKHYKLLFLIALGGSWLGDLFLMGDGQLFFILGILSFWVAQSCYLYLITKEIELPLKEILFSEKSFFPILVFGSYFVVIMSLLSAKLGIFALIVSGYALTMASIGAMSMILWRKAKDYKSLLLLLGVVLFIASDSMIAFNTFYFEENIFQYWVMATYIPAQFLICFYFKKTNLIS